MGRSSQRHDASRQRGSFARFFGQRRNRRITPRSTLLAGLDSRPDDDDLTILSWPSRLLERLRSFFRILGHTALSVLKVSIVVGALGGMGLGAYLAYQQIQRSKHFDINRILVTGARHALPSEIIERVGGVKGRSIFDVDLSLVARTVQRHPWIKRSKVIRQLPRTLRIDVIEEHIEAIILLDGLYLVSASGDIFKRASLAEAESVPLITGLTRQDLLRDAPSARNYLKKALAALSSYHRQPRPALSEVHVGSDGGVTFFLRHSGIALRFGQQFSEKRLRQLDAVWAALGPDASRARALYFDHKVRRSRVVVRMTDGPGL